MAVNLIDLFSSSVGRDLASKAASVLGESPKAVETAVDKAFPAILGGLLSKSSKSGGANDVFRMLTGSGVDASLLDNLGAAFGGGSKTDALMTGGSKLVDGLFGSKAGGVGSALSGIAGISGSNAGKLLAMASPAALGFLKRHVMQNKLDAAGVGRLLEGQSEFLKTGLDSRLTDAMGFGDVTSFLSKATGGAKDAARSATQTANRAAASTVQATKKGGANLGRWLAIAAAVALGAFLFRTLTNKDTVDAGAKAAESITDSLKQIELPGGRSISTIAGGPLASMVDYLNTGAGSARFTLDGINFTNSKINLTEATTASLNSVGEILMAYPDAVLKIEGPDLRVQAIERELEKRGVPDSRVVSEGKGTTGPIALVIEKR